MGRIPRHRPPLPEFIQGTHGRFQSQEMAINWRLTEAPGKLQATACLLGVFGPWVRQQCLEK